MSRFTENVHIQPLPKENLWVVTKDLEYHVGDEMSDDIVIVPAWYKFDGASVPMMFGMFLQRVEPKTLNAAAVHDWLYTWWRKYTRGKTDYIFFEALVVSGVSPIKAIIMWLWVALGWWLYRDKRI